MIVTQVGIAILGVAAVWLSQDAHLARRRWACVCGLAAQPFWLVETISHQQWGIAALTLLYGASWLRGFHTHWILPRRRLPA